MLQFCLPGGIIGLFGKQAYAARHRGASVGATPPRPSAIKPSARNTTPAYSSIFTWCSLLEVASHPAPPGSR